MPIKVLKVADISQGLVVACARGRDLAGILTTLGRIENPRKGYEWRVQWLIGEGPTKREIEIPIPPIIRESDPVDNPLFLADRRLVYFRDQLFMPERIPRTKVETEEVILRIKRSPTIKTLNLPGSGPP